MTRVTVGAAVGAAMVWMSVLVGCSPSEVPSGPDLVKVTVTDAQYGVTFDYQASPAFAPLRVPLADFPQSVAERDMLAAVNAERARGGVCPGGSFAPVGALQFEGHLHRAATLYGRELAASGGLTLPHRSAVDGRVPSQRMVDAGYRPVPPRGGQWVFGESLAGGAGLTAPAEVIAAWKGSSSHCAALFGAVSDASVARVDGAAGPYWVLNTAGWR
ncbi:CAP domain-containing protein [Deinococcus sedimenti]|uniref:CAP domain-containing protein n=1 Tax=Deinococcus sedimenti TaxID=1867090 RepID=A0ABQ2S4X4_9DEIO|nr:hypothetical protein [Deinococcus sedimenti]GGR98250.1 hypothetical protein GCM10008960_26100 [Deinococcus sedimenti]